MVLDNLKKTFKHHEGKNKHAGTMSAGHMRPEVPVMFLAVILRHHLC